MPERKMTIYLKATGKAIVITDRQKSMNIEEVKNKIKQLMSKKDTVAVFETSDDFVIIKSDDVSGIMLSAPGMIETTTSTKEIITKTITPSKPVEPKLPKPNVEPSPVDSPPPKKPETEDGNDYEQILVID